MKNKSRLSFTAVRYCKRCDELFTPVKKTSKICTNCYKPRGGYKKERWFE